MASMGKEKFYGLGRSETSYQKRSNQLKEWERSDTNKQPNYILSSRRIPRVKFGENVIFMAAVQSGDVEEVERLVAENGADVNSVNEDGLTALHQCCIDDDFEMVQVLVKLGGNVNVHDNEGWTPLHAAASCGHDHIVRYLLECGAFPAPVNNEGDTPGDLAEDEDIIDIIKEQIEKQGVNVEEVKNVEEQMMLEDANRLKNDASLSPLTSPGGATPLHVAASKNYLSVMKVLLSTKSTDVNAEDDDGWTPVHAAIYWGNMDAAELLVNHQANLSKITKAGDTVDELCDPDLMEVLEHLRKINEEQSTRIRRNAMILHRSTSQDHRTRPPLVHSNSRDDMKPSPVIRRRSSKERSLFPKMDMRQEREERENWSTDSATVAVNGAKPLDSIEVVEAESKTKGLAGGQPLTSAETANNIKETTNSLRESQAQSSSNHQPPAGASKYRQPEPSPDSSPNLSRKNDPSGDKAKKKTGMSAAMLQRVKLWEQQKKSPSPRTSTPLSSPQVSEKSLDEPVSKPEVRRYPFQSRSVPQDHSSGVIERKFSSDESRSKRVSVDEARLKNLLKTPVDSTPRSSSLPRGAKMEHVDHYVTPEKDVSVVSSEATPTPSSATDDSFHRNLSRAESVESNTSQRSVTEESTTKRKQRARETRKTRKATQPVPMDILEQISQHDLSELAEIERGEGEGQEQTGTVLAGKDKGSEPTARSSNGQDGELKKGREEKEDFKVVQSAYKPSARPTPRYRQNASSATGLWGSPERKKKDSLDESSSKTAASPSSPVIQVHDEPVSKKPVPDDYDGACMADDSSFLTPTHPRTKSTTRRRPREKRRSTGIGQCEVDENEEVPSELAGLVKKKTDSGSSSDNYPPSLDSSPAQTEEISRLKRLLEEERSKSQRLLDDYTRMQSEAEQHKIKVSELNRRCEDVSRAYDQEKREREQKEAKIKELMEGSKSLQELRSENRRLKDENSALIRVIGKLSRAPVHT